MSKFYHIGSQDVGIKKPEFVFKTQFLPGFSFTSSLLYFTKIKLFLDPDKNYVP